MEHIPEILTGRTIDRWQLGERFLATERYDLYHATTADGAAATVGILPSHRAENGPFRKRFLQECRLAGTVTSQHVLRYLGSGVSHGRLWFATEPTAGPSLFQRLDDGWKPDREQILAIAIQAWRGLAAVGAVGLTHRGLHPAMLFLDQDGTVRLGGFGLAPDPSGDEAIIAATDLAMPTACLAPEQIRGAPFDSRGDLYAMACVLYWVAAGRPPFIGETPASVREQHLQAEPQPPRRYATACPPDLSTMLLGILAKAPADRTPNSVVGAVQMCEDMRQRGEARLTTRRVLRTLQASHDAPPSTSKPAPVARTGVRRHAVLTAAGAVALAITAFIAWPRVPPEMAAQTPAVALHVPSTHQPLPVPAAPEVVAVVVERQAYPPIASPAPPRIDASAVQRLINQGDHIGPTAELRRRLGDPDVTQDDGGGWWYGDYLFVVEKDFVISGHHRPGQGSGR